MDEEHTEYGKYTFIAADDDAETYLAVKRLFASLTPVGLRHLGKDCQFRLQKLTREEYPENIARQARFLGVDTDDFAAVVLEMEMEGNWVYLDGLLEEGWGDSCHP